MVKLKFCIVTLSLVMASACGSPDQEVPSDTSNNKQLLMETDSLSNQLSTAGDSVEKKMEELQIAIEKLNN